MFFPLLYILDILYPQINKRKERGLLFISVLWAVESLKVRYINSFHASFFINYPFGKLMGSLEGYSLTFVDIKKMYTFEFPINNRLVQLKKGDTNIRSILEDLSVRDSESAFKSLYTFYCDRIMRYLIMYIKSPQIAEELLSDVFFALWENRKQLLDINNFDAYIFRIAKFRVLNYLRDNKSRTIDLDEVPIDLFAFTETTPEDDYISHELIDAVNNAIEQLPTKSKLAFKLVREDGMKYKDAADHLGISVKTLEAQLTFAMKKITKLFNID